MKAQGQVHDPGRPWTWPCFGFSSRQPRSLQLRRLTSCHFLASPTTLVDPHHHRQPYSYLLLSMRLMAIPTTPLVSCSARRLSDDPTPSSPVPTAQHTFASDDPAPLAFASDDPTPLTSDPIRLRLRGTPHCTSDSPDQPGPVSHPTDPIASPRSIRLSTKEH